MMAYLVEWEGAWIADEEFMDDDDMDEKCDWCGKDALADELTELFGERVCDDCIKKAGNNL